MKSVDDAPVGHLDFIGCIGEASSFGCHCFSFMELDVIHTLGLLLVLFLAIMGIIIYNMNIMLFFKTRI